MEFYLFLTIAMVICIETKAVKFPDDATTCSFIRRVHARCPFSVSTVNQVLFKESGLQEAVKQCDVTDITRLRNLRVDILTFVSMTSRCGVVFADPEEMEIPDEVMIEVVSKLLSWPTAIPTMNCMQVRRFLAYVTKYLLRFYNYLDQILDLLKSLGTENLSHILAVLPGQLCHLAVETDIQIYAPAQIPKLVDALAKNCHSRTILSSEVRCSWKDSPNPAVNARALTRMATGGNDTAPVCIPEGAGARCLVASPCVKLLCLLDLKERGCDSPCPKPASLSCIKNSTDKCIGTKTEAMSVSLPDPADATAESLQDFVCCLLRYPRKELKYSDEVLCGLQPPKDKRCLQAFTRWQITHAPKCLNCNTSSHFVQLLSPKCRQEAVKMYPTTGEEIKALMAMPGRRNVLLQLFKHLYRSLDLPLVQIVCNRGFMKAVNVDNFKKLGEDQLEPVLEKMTKCEESPARAKVLAVLVKGETCPYFLLNIAGQNFMRKGHITDKCLESMDTEEALLVCSVLMRDKVPQIPRSKIALMCKVLAKLDGENTCIFCNSRAATRGQSGDMTAVSPKVRVDRCLRLRLLARTSLNRAQREEIKLCKTCVDDSDDSNEAATGANPTRRPATMDEDGDPTRPWCDEDFEISGTDEIEKVLGNLCDIVQMMREDTRICPNLRCFVRKAVTFYKEYLKSESSSEAQTEFSVLRYLSLFMPNNDRTQLPSNLQWLRCGSVCPFVKEAYKTFLSTRSGTRGKRDTCYVAEVIEGFTQLEDGGALTNIIEPDELNCLGPEETRDIVRTGNLHMEDWTSAQARVLLNKLLQALGKTNVKDLTVDELRELGLILIALTPEQIAELQDLDSTTFAIIGSSTLWTKEQHRALVEKYLRQEGRGPTQITEDDLFILQNLVNGFTDQEARSFPTAAVREASAVLGDLELCDIHLVSAFIYHFKQAYGNASSWDESQLAEYSHLLGGLSAEEWNAHGLTILAHIPDHVWRYHVTENKYNALEGFIREVITERQLELIKETGDCSAKNEAEIPKATDPTTDSGASSGSRGLWTFLVCVLLVGLTLY